MIIIYFYWQLNNNLIYYLSNNIIITGTVKDLSWSFDNQRIVAVGEGREKFGHVFMAETGTSVGEISGHSRTINSCDFRPCRPMKIGDYLFKNCFLIVLINLFKLITVTGGEDNLICYQGKTSIMQKRV